MRASSVRAGPAAPEDATASTCISVFMTKRRIAERVERLHEYLGESLGTGKIRSSFDDAIEEPSLERRDDER